MYIKSSVSVAALAASSFVAGIELDVNNADSMKSAAQTAAAGLVDLYLQSTNTTGAPGAVGKPYYWWYGGLVLDSLIRYWAATGDDQYNSMITRDLLFQRGENNDFAPANQSATLFNSDQAAWAAAALSAVEYGFPESPEAGASWQTLATNVFNEQASRWDKSTCGGGLRWALMPFQSGYEYKDATSNTAFFSLAARLARISPDNDTYITWAENTNRWLRDVEYIDNDGNVYDGATTTNDCGNVNQVQFSLVSGLAANGAAAMQNRTSASSWGDNTRLVLDRALTLFANDSVLQETACETINTCNKDQRAFKGVFARYLGAIAVEQPDTAQAIRQVLSASAGAAAASCSGKDLNGSACGFSWTAGKFDNDGGMGQQMAALDVFVANIMVANGGATAKPATSSSSSSQSTGTSDATSDAASSGTPSSSAPSPAETTGAASRSTAGMAVALAAVAAASFLV